MVSILPRPAIDVMTNHESRAPGSGCGLWSCDRLRLKPRSIRREPGVFHASGGSLGDLSVCAVREHG